MVSEVRDYAIFMLDPKGLISNWNEGAQRIKGYSAEEIVGKHFSCFYSKEDINAGKPYEELKIALSEGRIEDEGLRVRKDGSRFVANVVITALRDKAGKLVGFSKVTRDITERKQAEERIEILNEHLMARTQDLERSNKDLQEFAYVASHDLQEPLRMVASFTQLLAKRYKGKLDSDADDFIGYAVDGANRMQKLIQDLLSYSRVGTRGKDFQPTDCEAVLIEARENLRAAIEETGAVITHDPLPTVMADKAQLTQLFQNLLSNAIKFHGEEPPSIHVSAEQKGMEWTFSVRDNGIGMDSRYFTRVFVIFQRLHGRDEYGGTGIGLALCRRIVHRHGGKIWVESEPGKGSTFFFAFPILRR